MGNGSEEEQAGAEQSGRVGDKWAGGRKNWCRYQRAGQWGGKKMEQEGEWSGGEDLNEEEWDQ